ncbi:MAG: NAD-dependent epimerase/dehydratase family protein [Candidatus Njordarchaeota archaeon]
MKILVVGGTGHIGSYLVPKLVLAGHDVTVIARHKHFYYTYPFFRWEDRVEWILIDRRKAEKDGSWKKLMESINVDIVIDLICYTLEQNCIMVEALKGRIRQFIHCGSIWAYGPSRRVPYKESYPRRPIGRYGINKAKIEEDLIKEYQTNGFPATIIHPGHISGRRWLPIDPQATRNGVGIYEKLAKGEIVYLPDTGLSTLHHVHASDLAQLFIQAIEHRNQAIGEAFSGVAPYAMTLLGITEYVASLFGKEPNIKFVPLTQMESILGPEAYAITKDHVIHSPNCSIEKAKRLLGYEPRYTIEDIYRESIEYLLETEILKV